MAKIDDLEPPSSTLFVQKILTRSHVVSKKLLPDTFSCTISICQRTLRALIINQEHKLLYSNIAQYAIMVIVAEDLCTVYQQYILYLLIIPISAHAYWHGCSRCYSLLFTGKKHGKAIDKNPVFMFLTYRRY